MRVVIALLKHETNTFSPVPTPLSRFGNGGPAWGEDAFRAYKGTATPMGAFIDLAEAEGADIVTPVAAEAWPSGPVHDDAYARLTDSILEEVAKGCDCVLLDLHGAMVTESLEDGEGELLARVRALAPACAGGRGARPSRQPVAEDRRQCHRHRRLQDLSPCRYVRDRRPRRADHAPGAEGPVAAYDGLGQPADAAACDADGDRRSPHARSGRGGARVRRGRRAGRQRLRRLSPCRHP